MYEKISKKMVEYAVANNIIDEKECDVYLYAYTALLSHAITLFSIFFVGILFDRTLQTALFLVAFYPIRVYAGGFHRNTFKHCYFTSLAIFIIVILLEMLLVNNMIFVYILLAAAVILLLKEMPQESENKPLSKKEVVKYKKQGRLVLIFILIIILSSIALSAPVSFKYYTAMGVITVGCLLAAGMKNKHRKQ